MVGQPVTMVVQVEDDSMPRVRRRCDLPTNGPRRLSRRQLTPPSRVTVAKVVGLHLSWFVYRGEGNVTFDTPNVKVWEDTRTGANSPRVPL